MRVDPGATVLQPRRDAHRLADVVAPHRRREPIVRIVGPRDRLVRVFEARHRHYRPEYLAAHDLVALLRARNDGGLEKETAATARLAAGRDLDVTALVRAVDEAG